MVKWMNNTKIAAFVIPFLATCFGCSKTPTNPSSSANLQRPTKLSRRDTSQGSSQPQSQMAKYEQELGASVYMGNTQIFIRVKRQKWESLSATKKSALRQLWYKQWIAKSRFPRVTVRDETGKKLAVISE